MPAGHAISLADAVDGQGAADQLRLDLGDGRELEVVIDQMLVHVVGHHVDVGMADEHVGHDKHAGHSVTMFRNKFWITLLLTVPTLIWGEMLPRLLHFTPPAVPGAPHR